MMSDVDAEIKRLLDNGDQEKAFRLIVSKTSRRLYIVVRRILGEHILSDDVLQDVYLKVFERIDQFEWKSSLYTWMHTIAVRRALHIKRKEFSRSQDDITKSLVVAPEWVAFDKWMKIFESAIGELPKRQQQVFLLRYYEEMPYSTMSKRMNLSEGGLKSNYHLAVKKIKENIKKQGLL